MELHSLGENNYALSTMILSVNGVPKKVTDNILDGYAKTEDELKSKATYEKPWLVFQPCVED